MCYNIQQSENPRQKGDRNGLRRYGIDGKSRVQREASQMKLPLDLSQELKKRGHRFLCKSIVGTLLFWGISMTAWFVAGSSLFRMQAHPVLFWGVFGILLVLPVLLFGFYRLVAYPEVTGMVSKLTGGGPSAGKRTVPGTLRITRTARIRGSAGTARLRYWTGRGKPMFSRFREPKKRLLHGNIIRSATWYTIRDLPGTRSMKAGFRCARFACAAGTSARRGRINARIAEPRLCRTAQTKQRPRTHGSPGAAFEALPKSRNWRPHLRFLETFTKILACSATAGEIFVSSDENTDFVIVPSELGGMP